MLHWVCRAGRRHPGPEMPLRAQWLTARQVLDLHVPMDWACMVRTWGAERIP